MIGRPDVPATFIIKGQNDVARKLPAAYSKITITVLAPIGMPANFAMQQPETSNVVAVPKPWNVGDLSVDIEFHRVSQNAEAGYGVVLTGTGYNNHGIYFPVEAYVAAQFDSSDESTDVLGV